MGCRSSIERFVEILDLIIEEYSGLEVFRLGEVSFTGRLTVVFAVIGAVFYRVVLGVSRFVELFLELIVIYRLGFCWCICVSLVFWIFIV